MDEKLTAAKKEYQEAYNIFQRKKRQKSN